VIGLLGKVDSLRHRLRRGRLSADLASGRRGEDLAHRLLRRQGLTVVARNYRTRSGRGEIDLVAWDGDTLVFVEVKSRASEEFGPPDRAVDREKREFLVRAAAEYAARARIPWERVRFDVVSVILSAPPSVSWVAGAFRPRPPLY
jgi:putative endonuclease